MRESLVGDEVTAVKGIVSRTRTVLDKMHTEAPRSRRCWPRRSGSGAPRRTTTADVEAWTPRPRPRSWRQRLAFHSRVKLEDVDLRASPR
ncbi:MAG: hypothetical protein R2719_10515 [Micropruina sp.]